jgi:uncharacterized Zn finger protein
VKYLNDQKIPTPAEYNNHFGHKKTYVVTSHPLWDHTKVSRILRREEYTGKLVMRKKIQPVPCVRKYRKTTPEEQFVREHSHEAIVTQEEFNRVQEMIPRRKGWDRRNQRMYPLKKLVRCGTCGKVMKYMDTPAPGGFCCADSRIEHSVCSRRIQPREEVEEIVYQRIKHLFPMLKAQGELQKTPKSTSDQSERRMLTQKQQDMKRKKVQLYEQFLSGELSLEDYLAQKKDVSQSELELQQRISTLKQQVSTPSAEIPPSELVSVMGEARRFEKTPELTSEMAKSFIEAVLVFDDCIKIKWKFDWLGEMED